jgi:polysaccharide biosynthesis/export protein
MRCYAIRFAWQRHFPVMNLRIFAIIIFLAGSWGPKLSAQAQLGGGTSLSIQKLGPDDLIQIQVFGFPEFSRAARISANGTIQLPLVKNPIQVSGKVPAEIENEIAETLRSAELVVNPAVTVSILEYGSRPVTVAGAVKSPVLFQAIGRVTLIDAITRAGGLAPDAGPEILINRRPLPGDESKPVITQHINARVLLSEDGVESNIILTGGEEIRVPTAGKVYVVGDVKSSGSFPVTDNTDTTVLKVLSLAGGVGTYPSAEAYIIRRDEITGTKHKIAIDLRGILKQKTPDFPLLADDIFFVPDDAKRKQTSVILDRLSTYGAAIATGLIIYTAGR